MNKMKLFFYILIFMSFNVRASEPLSHSSFYQAFDLYNQGEYLKSIELYQRLLLKVDDRGEIYYNLANSYFKNGDLAEAIFNYKMALTLMPRNGDVLYNLNYARSQTKDKIEDIKLPLLKSLFPFSKIEWIYIFAFLSFLFWGGLILNFFYSNENFKWIRGIALVFFIIMIFPFYQFTFMKNNFGVVVKENVNVYSGPGVENIVLFGLHRGSEFNILKTLKNEWIYIELADGKKGHLKKSSVLTQ